MEIGFWTPERADAVRGVLETLEEWCAASRFFTAPIRLSDEISSALFDIRSGRVMTGHTSIADVNATVISGPRADWERVSLDMLDWFQATTPGHGNMIVGGDPVFVMRNVKIFSLLFAVDAPGHGKSMMPERGALQSLTAHAVFKETFIEKLGLERPVIMGCSMGGNLVLEMAARRPGNYAAVISCEGADYTPGRDKFVLDILMVNGQQMLECYSQSLTGKRTPPDRAREVIWQLCRSTPEVMRADLTGYAGFDKREEMARIADPVLLIRGSDDWLVTQEQVEDTARRIAKSEVALLDGTGH